MSEKKKEEQDKPEFARRFRLIGSGRERSYFMENLGLMLASGMNISAALKALLGELRSRPARKVLSEVYDDIMDGLPLWRALEKSGFAENHAVALIKIGEESGRLKENLKVIAEKSEKERLFRSRLKSAMIYPAIVIALSLLIAIAVAWFIMPKLARVFASLGLELPFLTRLLIEIGNFLSDSGVIALPLGAAILGILSYIFLVFRPARRFFEAAALNLPGLKRLIWEIELARFGYLLGTMLKAGLPIFDALDSMSAAARFQSYRNFYGYLKESIKDGNSFQKSFAANLASQKFFPPTVRQTIVAGEQSGRLAEALTQIGESYEAKSELTTKNLTVIFEPVLLVLVWIGVVIVALSIILPIYRLIGGLSR